MTKQQRGKNRKERCLNQKVEQEADAAAASVEVNANECRVSKCFNVPVPDAAVVAAFDASAATACII